MASWPPPISAEDHHDPTLQTSECSSHTWKNDERRLLHLQPWWLPSGYTSKSSKCANLCKKVGRGGVCVSLSLRPTCKRNVKNKLSRQDTPNSVGGVNRSCIIMLMMMPMLLMMLMMMMMRGRWWCGCLGRGGGGRWWCWGGWCWGGRPIPRPGSTLCVILRGRNVHGHFTRALLCGNIQEKCRTPSPRHPFCASLRSRNAHGHVRRGICAETYEENAGRFSRGQRFVRACAVKIHMDMSQEAFCAEIYRENAKRPRYHLDWTPGLNTYRKNPSLWTHCLGNNME